MARVRARFVSMWLGRRSVSRDRAILAMVFAVVAVVVSTVLAIAGDGLARIVWGFLGLVMLAHGLANALCLTSSGSG